MCMWNCRRVVNEYNVLESSAQCACSSWAFEKFCRLHFPCKWLPRSPIMLQATTNMRTWLSRSCSRVFATTTRLRTHTKHRILETNSFTNEQLKMTAYFVACISNILCDTMIRCVCGACLLWSKLFTTTEVWWFQHSTLCFLRHACVFGITSIHMHIISQCWGYFLCLLPCVLHLW